MRKELIILGLMGGFLAGAMTSASAGEARPVTLKNTQEFLSGPEEDPDRFRIFVAEPEGEAPPNGYPVIYIMDGNSNFGAMREELIRATNSTYRIPTVLVAIGYPEDDPWNKRRDHDLTPKLPGGELPIGPWGGEMPDTGGADDTLDYIQDVLKPEIEAKFPIDKAHETLTGHSFGGLFTLHTFFTRPEMFSTFVAMSPSIWFGDEYLLTEEAAYRENYEADPDDAELYILVGRCEEIVGECDPGIKSTDKRDAWLLSNGKMVTNAEAMTERLQAIRGDDVQNIIIDGEHHISVIGASLAWVTKATLSDFSAEWDEADPTRRQ